MPITSRLPQLMADKKIRSINKLAKETGVGTPALYRLYDGTNVRIDYTTLEALCAFFDCGIGDILVYIKEQKG
jgi:putative transcriptional regulator